MFLTVQIYSIAMTSASTAGSNRSTVGSVSPTRPTGASPIFDSGDYATLAEAVHAASLGEGEKCACVPECM